MDYKFCLLNISWLMDSNVQPCMAIEEGKKEEIEFCLCIVWERLLETAPDGRLHNFRAVTQIYRKRCYCLGDVFTLETAETCERLLFSNFFFKFFDQFSRHVGYLFSKQGLNLSPCNGSTES